MSAPAPAPAATPAGTESGLGRRTLTGRLVRLEPIGPAHLDALLEAATADRSTFTYTFVPADRDGFARYLRVAGEDDAAGTSLSFATISLASGRLVGSTRLRELEYWPAAGPPRAMPPTPGALPDAAEIGSTWLTSSAQRTGVNVEAKLLMLGHAFDTWGVKRVSLKTDVRNERSRAAITALGARPEGVRRAHFVAADGTLRDSMIFSILHTEWPQVRENLRQRLARYETPA